MATPIPFNANWYLSQNPDVAAAVQAGLTDAETHFQQYGRLEGRSASFLLDVEHYLANNPDVAEAVLAGTTTPWDHAQQYGVAEGRFMTRVFDEAFYLQSNPDVVQAIANGVIGSGLEHFVLVGHTEQRPVNPVLDLTKYLAANPDVAQAAEAGAIDPLAHLLTYGITEGRSLGNGIQLPVFDNDPLFTGGLTANNHLDAWERVKEIAPFVPTFERPAGWTPPADTPIPVDFRPPAGSDFKLLVPPEVTVPAGVTLSEQVFVPGNGTTPTPAPNPVPGNGPSPNPAPVVDDGPSVVTINSPADKSALTLDYGVTTVINNPAGDLTVTNNGTGTVIVNGVPKGATITPLGTGPITINTLVGSNETVTADLTNAGGIVTLDNDGAGTLAVTNIAKGKKLTLTGSGPTTITDPAGDLNVENNGSGMVTVTGVKSNATITPSGTGPITINRAVVSNETATVDLTNAGGTVILDNDGAGTLAVTNAAQGKKLTLTGSGPTTIIDPAGNLNVENNGSGMITVTGVKSNATITPSGTGPITINTLVGSTETATVDLTNAGDAVTLDNDGAGTLAVTNAAQGKKLTLTGSGPTTIIDPVGNLTVDNNGSGTVTVTGAKADAIITTTGEALVAIDLSNLKSGEKITINNTGTGTVSLLNEPSGVIVEKTGTIDATPTASAFTATSTTVGATSNEAGLLGLYNDTTLLSDGVGGTLSTPLTAGKAATIAVKAQSSVTSATLKVSDTAGNFAFDTRNVVLGTNNGEVLNGTSGRDFIYGFEGNDTLSGGGGADTLTGGTGNDRFVFNSTFGTSSDSDSNSYDTLTDMDAGDILVANLSNVDAFDATSGSYVVQKWQSLGNLLILDATGSVGDGLDNQGNVWINIGTRAPHLAVNQVEYHIVGTNANNVIKTNKLNDTITGGAGADKMDGGSGNNVFVFNTGDVASGETVAFKGTTDTFRVDTTTDFSSMNSGSLLTGLDVVTMAANQGATFLHTQLTGLTFSVNGDNNGAIEVLTVNGTDDPNTIDLAKVTVQNGAGISINGKGGDDVITGTAGNDIITGGAGADKIDVGSGTDLVVLRDGDSAANNATGSSVITSGMDIYTGLSFGDQLEIYRSITWNYFGSVQKSTSSVGGVDDAIMFTRGTYNAGNNTFTASASGTDSLVTYDVLIDYAGGTDYESIVLVGFVGQSNGVGTSSSGRGATVTLSELIID